MILKNAIIKDILYCPDILVVHTTAEMFAIRAYAIV